MIKLTSDCFECTDCGVEILINTKKSEVIKGSTEYTVNCSNCDAKYIIDGSNAYILPPDLYKKQVKTKLKSNDRVNPFYVVLLVIIIIAVVITGLTVLPKKYNELKSDLTTQKASTLPSIQTPINSVASNNTKVDCNFEIAKSKAISKADKMNFHYVGDIIAPEQNLEPCRIKYHFYVKKRVYDSNGAAQIEDKIYELSISYNMIGDTFEYMGSFLYDPQNNKGVNLN